MRWPAVVLIVLVALGGALLLVGRHPDPLPEIVWVLGREGGGMPDRVCCAPAGEAIPHGSIAWGGDLVSLWPEPSPLDRLLGRVGVSRPAAGVTYERTGLTSEAPGGTWHEYRVLADG